MECDMPEADERNSPILRKRDVFPPLIGASLLLLLDAYLFLPGLGLLLALLMILVSVSALLVKLLRRRGGKAKAFLKMVTYCTCVAGIFYAHTHHKDNARRNAAPVIAATEQYHQDHGNWPAQLTLLVPDYLPALPRATWRLNPGRYILRVNEETNQAVLWWPAHMRVMLVYDFQARNWVQEVWD